MRGATFVLYDAIKTSLLLSGGPLQGEAAWRGAGACAAAGEWGPLQLIFVPTQTSSGGEPPHQHFCYLFIDTAHVDAA